MIANLAMKLPALFKLAIDKRLLLDAIALKCSRTFRFILPSGFGVPAGDPA